MAEAVSDPLEGGNLFEEVYNLEVGGRGGVCDAEAEEGPRLMAENVIQDHVSVMQNHENAVQNHVGVIRNHVSAIQNHENVIQNRVDVIQN